jgi:hypothetical protein
MAVGELRCLRPRLLLVLPFYVSRAIASGLLLLKAHPSRATPTKKPRPTNDRLKGSTGSSRLQGPHGLEVVAVDREKVRAEFFKIYPAENAKAKRESL